MLKIALVVNEPPPYRIPVFNQIAATPGIEFQVIFCCRREPNRCWDLPAMVFDHRFLRERIRTVNDRYIHNNPDVWPALSRFMPDVVVGNGFNPTHLYAMAWAGFKRKPYVPMTDGTADSERGFSRWHKYVRRLVYARAPACLAASQGGIALYRSYGVSPQRCLLSCLCIDNARFYPPQATQEKRYDFIFCSRIEAGKNPAFALKLARQTSTLLGRRVQMLFVGSGSQENATRSLARSYASELDVDFHGFATQAELPALYQSARLFLFPTLGDVWGVVANEACAAGLPVLVSPHAGVAGELVVDGKNGYVCALDTAIWAEHAATLLQDDALRTRFAQQSLHQVGSYRFELAAQGIVDACRAATQVPAGSRQFNAGIP